MSSINIQYTKVPSSSYSQQTLGDNSGTRIETDQIRLEPWLLERDTPLLWELYKDHPELFTYMPHGQLHTYEDFYKHQANFFSIKDWVNWVCYVSAHPTKTGEDKKWVLCGQVALLDISLLHRRFEVGAIWLNPTVHGTFVMVEMTYALLRFAFERLQAGRVQWKTHHKNMASQKSAIKLGFSQDGLHKKHMIDADGNWRHTYFYSMMDDDWYGREETTDGQRGLDVATVGAAVALKQASAAPQGRQQQLEETIARRKKEGKALTVGITLGQPLA
ncbi:MAG: acyl-CoA N-acyltransferase [Benniella sp.]|nr:MAG: acyl-CoA N-acyltransferase [Benniella sp.]